MANRQLNVFSKPLALFSKDPITGFFRDGYCRTGPQDNGNHAIAATVTTPFLEYSAKQGNDLRPIGLTSGCKWCLCVNRWKEAVDAAARAEIDEKDVPRVHLHATNESALVGGLLMPLRRIRRVRREPCRRVRREVLDEAVKESIELASKGDMTSR